MVDYLVDCSVYLSVGMWAVERVALKVGYSGDKWDEK
jgi:hypothetical protein